MKPNLQSPLAEAREGGRLVSYSSVSKWQRCKLQWKFSYIDKILTPPNRAMLMGSLFDEMCGGFDILRTPYWESVLSREDIDLVVDHYKKYRHHISDTDVQQMLVWAEVGLTPIDDNLGTHPIYLHGYVDRVVMAECNECKGAGGFGFDVDTGMPIKGYTCVKCGGSGITTLTLPIDHKFTKDKLKPKRRKDKTLMKNKDGSLKYEAKPHWKQQARFYLWMLQKMGHDIKRFEFHVMNSEDDELIIISYKPLAQTVAHVPFECMEAWEGMQFQWYPPYIDRHCAWCDHEERCTEYRTRRLEL